MKIQYLGQAGFLIEGMNSRILVDPYLSNYVIDGGYGSVEGFSRNFPPPIKPGFLKGIDGVFITHNHADHCDLDTLKVIYKNNPDCFFIGPYPVREKLKSINISENRLLIPHSGKIGSLLDTAFWLIPAAHYEVIRNQHDEEPECMGYLIKVDNTCIYHAGDTLLFEGMEALIRQPGWKINIACLPVNGRDAAREKMGIVGNLTAAEAINLAKKIDARVMIPMHNDLFTINQENPEVLSYLFNKEKGLQIWVLQPGEEITVE
jgi:L-ascorbate metabolism protein UlaG (beta-lactamase superfamily)